MHQKEFSTGAATAKKLRKKQLFIVNRLKSVLNANNNSSLH